MRPYRLQVSWLVIQKTSLWLKKRINLNYSSHTFILLFSPRICLFVCWFWFCLKIRKIMRSHGTQDHLSDFVRQNESFCFHFIILRHATKNSVRYRPHFFGRIQDWIPDHTDFVAPKETSDLKMDYFAMAGKVTIWCWILAGLVDTSIHSVGSRCTNIKSIGYRAKTFWVSNYAKSSVSLAALVACLHDN